MRAYRKTSMYPVHDFVLYFGAEELAEFLEEQDALLMSTKHGDYPLTEKVLARMSAVSKEVTS
ncbi:hypothetical protein [Streptomyces sp. 135]|uniref:hypothetical protein n=1 Tax=Streptomyces sp. 135 TaxID=2838850 RepID=UPI001CBCB22E|nr:hypothetical protein [Streptomyces sp. 135]